MAGEMISLHQPLPYSSPEGTHANGASSGLRDLLLGDEADEALRFDRWAAVEQALRLQRSPLGAFLRVSGEDESAVLQRLSERLGFRFIPHLSVESARSVRDRIPVAIAVKHGLVSLQLFEETGMLEVACADPFDLQARQELALAINEGIIWVLSPMTEIAKALQQVYGIGADTLARLITSQTAADDDGPEDAATVLDADDPEASVARFANQILKEALRQRATDIHIEPLEEDLRIRYRIDGMLQHAPVPPQVKALKASLIARLKIMARLDIAEKRLPQDGRINLQLDGKQIDVRVATIPSVEGESISLRLLKQQSFNFEQMGLDPEDEWHIRELLAMPNGIVLLTGPTGCGKSSSLYTFLSALNQEQRRIVTIEDPVEHKLAGVIQIAVKPEIGLTFAAGLRSVLRGDPNVIMIGEMRDQETAETAMRSALTGHLVFSTLHTNDSVGGITRLIDLGIEPFLVASSVRAFIAQRLVRLLCPLCKQATDVSNAELEAIGESGGEGGTWFKAGTCESCRHTGYSGRTAIFEICRINHAMHDLVAKNSPTTALRQCALANGMHTLRAAGLRKARRGMTSIEEVLRVTSMDGEMDEN